MAKLDLVNFDEILKDHYPTGGKLKQYVVDGREREALIQRTSPKFKTPPHDDNTGASCVYSCTFASHANLGSHHCCYVCNDIAEAHENDESVISWRKYVASLPPICEDRSKYSDDDAPDLRLDSIRLHPMFKR